MSFDYQEPVQTLPLWDENDGDCDQTIYQELPCPSPFINMKTQKPMKNTETHNQYEKTYIKKKERKQNHPAGQPHSKI